MAPPVVSVDQIVKQLTTSQDGFDNGRQRTWFTNSVNYSLPTTSPIGKHHEEDGFDPLTQHQRDMARLSFQLWSDLMNLDLVEASGDPNDAQITLAQSAKTDNRTHTHHDSVGTSAADSPKLVDERIWLARQWKSNLSPNIQFGLKGFQTYIHEIGHALGLSHPGSYDATDGTAPTYANDAEYSRDTLQYSVMSYFGEDSDHSGANYKDLFPSTPMVDDILAIQSKYGADMTTRTDNTVYGFNCNLPKGTTTDKLEHDLYDFSTNKKPVYTIWDAGGSDTLDASGFNNRQRIDLNDGAYSDIGGLKQNIAIAHNVTIENAIGGSGKDTITGNNAANRLEGRADNDTLEGGGGHDTLVGGSGDDTYVLGAATAAGPVALFDTIVEKTHSGVDTVQVGRSTVFSKIGIHGDFRPVTARSYKLASFVENGTVTGTGDFDLTGNSADNKLVGNTAVNKLDGSTGNDTLTGFAGADQFVFSGKHFGNDTVTDFAASGSVHDMIVVDKSLCANFDTVKRHMHDAVVTNGTQQFHNTILDFGTDKTITVSNVSAAQLTKSDFQFV